MLRKTIAILSVPALGLLWPPAARASYLPVNTPNAVGNIGIGGHCPHPVRPENKIGRQADAQRPGWTDGSRKVFNVFADDFGGFSARTSIRSVHQIRRLLKWPVPSLASFFVHHINACQDQSHTNYTNNYAYRQGQIFEEITGKTDRQNVFTQVIDGFCGKLPGLFIKNNAHDKFLSFVSVGERWPGEAAADVTEIGYVLDKYTNKNLINRQHLF